MRSIGQHLGINHGGHGLLFMLGGVVVGAAVGLLTAPQSGERTRRQLRRKTEDIKEQTASLCSKLVDTVEDLRRGVARQIDAGKQYLGGT